LPDLYHFLDAHSYRNVFKKGPKKKYDQKVKTSCAHLTKILVF